MIFYYVWIRHGKISVTEWWCSVFLYMVSQGWPQEGTQERQENLRFRESWYMLRGATWEKHESKGWWTATSKQDLWASAFPGAQGRVHKQMVGGDCMGAFVSYQVMVRLVQRDLWPGAPGHLGRMLTTYMCAVQEEREVVEAAENKIGSFKILQYRYKDFFQTLFLWRVLFIVFTFYFFKGSRKHQLSISIIIRKLG